MRKTGFKKNYFLNPIVIVPCSGGEEVCSRVRITGNDTFDDAGFEDMNYGLAFANTAISNATGLVHNQNVLAPLAGRMVADLCSEKECEQSGCFLRKK